MQDESMVSTLGPFAFCIGVALSSSEKNKIEGFEKRKVVNPKYKYLIDDTVKDILLYRAIQMSEENMIQFFEKANSKLSESIGSINL